MTRRKKNVLQAPDFRGSTVLGYLLRIQKARGPVMTWNGKSFSDHGTPHVFAREDRAKHEGQLLLMKFPILQQYKIWVDLEFHTPAATNSKKDRALRGGSKINPKKRGRVLLAGSEFTLMPGTDKNNQFYNYLRGQGHSVADAKATANARYPKRRKKNPSPKERAELDDAARRLENFSGHPVARLESAYSRSPQQTGMIIGELDLIGYRAKRDGKVERYGHPFRKNSRPLLAVTSDGKQLHIVGGQYEFTEAGIEDR